jgi:hypothetical protein
MQQELSGPNPTPLETLMIQRFLAHWVQILLASALAAHAQELDTARAQPCSLQKHQESAQRCLAEAVEQLASCRTRVLTV